MKPLSNIDDSFNLSAVSEVTHDISSDHVDAKWTQPDIYLSTLCKIYSNSWPVLKTLVLMPSNVQMHRQVPLKDTNFQKKQILLYTNYYRNMTP